jgi:hypothetical protein
MLETNVEFVFKLIEKPMLTFWRPVYLFSLSHFYYLFPFLLAVIVAAN